MFKRFIRLAVIFADFMMMLCCSAATTAWIHALWGINTLWGIKKTGQRSSRLPRRENSPSDNRKCSRSKYALAVLWLVVWMDADAASRRVAIASANPLATNAGFEIIAKGGNVFDAAVAVGAALAVVEPSGSGLGGGGYWLLHRQQDGLDSLIDSRETAPGAAHRDMFLDSDGNVVPQLSLDGALAAGIPGVSAALAHISQKYGQLPLSESLAPAIRYAQYGFAIGHRHLKLLKLRADTLKKYPQTARIFLTDGQLPPAFTLLRQPDLAETLRHIAESGHAGFYRGPVADRLVAGVKQGGGIWTHADLANYRIVERKPVIGHYRGVRITSAAPSSSGGTVLIEALNILSGYALQDTGNGARTHLIAEALRRAYRDRAHYLGDSDFITVPLQRLLSPDYAAALRSDIRIDRATPSQGAAPQEGGNTTHFSIIDDQGNRVATTLSINFPFGSGFVADGTGVVLNDEMDDFVSKPGSMNGYGLVGGNANAIAPGKRMLSSMTPTFLEDATRIAALGTPGGSRIPSMVLLATLAFAEGESPESWVNRPRFHHQYLPDVLEYEPNALTAAELSELGQRGHKTQQTRYAYGDMQAVLLDKTTRRLSGASDRRGEGRAVIGQ